MILATYCFEAAAGDRNTPIIGSVVDRGALPTHSRANRNAFDRARFSSSQGVAASAREVGRSRRAAGRKSPHRLRYVLQAGARPGCCRPQPKGAKAGSDCCGVRQWLGGARSETPLIVFRLASSRRVAASARQDGVSRLEHRRKLLHPYGQSVSVRRGVLSVESPEPWHAREPGKVYRIINERWAAYS